jgi:iron complex outermembrane receptor protein
MPAAILLLAGMMLLGTAKPVIVSAEEGPTAGLTDAERAQRVRDLTAEANRIREELRQLPRRPEGMARSATPRSEHESQPTRTMRESLESLPGVTARQGPGGRDAAISIRGSGK